jgi:hypothetical protein
MQITKSIIHQLEIAIETLRSKAITKQSIELYVTAKPTYQQRLAPNLKLHKRTADNNKRDRLLRATTQHQG